MPLYINPAEYLLELTDSDFPLGDERAQGRLEKMYSDWRSSAEASSLTEGLTSSMNSRGEKAAMSQQKAHGTPDRITLALLHRSFIKSYRDIVAYGIRFAMYIGLAIMMGTVWLRLSPTQSHIQPFINAIVSAVSKARASTLTKGQVLWFRIHVVHGSRLCAVILGRPRYVHQGTC